MDEADPRAKFAQEVDAFRTKCEGQQTDVAASLSEARELKKRAREIRAKLRRLAFQGDFFKFYENELPESNLIGRLEACGQDIEEETGELSAEPPSTSTYPPYYLML